MNRHQKRALSKMGLQKTVSKLQEATTGLEALQQYQGLPAQIGEAVQLMKDAHATVGALVDDYQALADEHEALKQMVFNLMGVDRSSNSEAIFNQHLNRIRSERSG